MANKMTKRQVIESMLKNEAISGNSIYTEFLQNELTLMDAKNEKRRAKANAGADVLDNAIKEALADGVAKTITQMKVANEVLGNPNLSVQKISASANRMLKAGVLTAKVEKGSKLFSLAVAEEETVVEADIEVE